MNDFKTNILKQVLKTLDDNNIKYCVLRNYNELPYKIDSKDVDILVERENVKQVNRIIKHIVKSHNELMLLSEKHEYVQFFRIFNGAECLKLDFTYNYDAKIVTFLTGMQLFEYTDINKNGISILDRTMTACIAWHKNIFIVGKVNEKYKELILSTFSEDEDKFIKYMSLITGNDITDMLVQYLKSNRILESKELADKVVKYGIKKQKNRAYRIFRIINHLFIEMNTRFKNGKRNLISLHGPDGAGKSTVAESLKPMIADAFCIDEKDVIIKHFRPYLIPNISVLFSRDKEKALQDIEENIHNPHEAKPAGFISSIVRLAYYSFDYFAGYWLKVFPAASRGGIVIFDRYYIDYYVDSIRSRINVPKFFVTFFGLLIRYPFASFVLSGDAGCFYQRKQELKKQEIKRQIDAYNALSEEKSFVHSIDGTSTADEVAKEILKTYIDLRCR